MPDRKRVLLVGGTGRVGNLVLHHWYANAPESVELIEQHRDADRVTGHYWPLQNAPVDRLTDLQIDSIVCLAGVTPGPGADLSLNEPIAMAVLRAAQEAGIARVLMASSSAVYGAGDGNPFSEASTAIPINAYGEAKLTMERACAPWREKGLEVCCLRIGNVAGADALLLNVEKSHSDQPLTIDCFPDGRGPVRSYIGAGTLSEILCNLATQPTPLPPILNVAAPSTIYMEDLARAATHPFNYRPAKPNAHQHITLDCTALMAHHTFAADASDANEMVAQWKETLSQ